MLEQREKTFVLTPFVVAYPEREEAPQGTPKPRKPGSHLSKDDAATREVLQRIVQRVKKI